MDAKEHRRRRSVGWARIGGPFGLVGALLGAAQACTYDPSHPCGANEAVYGDNFICVCVDGSAMTQYGCVACGPNEVPGDGGCDCASGYARPSAGSACAAIPRGLGAACDAASPCVDTTYDTCAGGADASADGGGDGYCTNTGCATANDCSLGYGCDTSVSPSVCRRPPDGQGKACTSNMDCAGTEATYCDTVVTKTCLVQGCTVSPDDCFVGWTCCDLSSFGVPAPICLQGACP